MNNQLFALAFIFAAMALTAIGLVAENVITNQICQRQYRLVRVLWLARRMPFAASIALLGFSFFLSKELPLGEGRVMFIMALLVVLPFQVKSLFRRNWGDILRYGANPAVAGIMALCFYLSDLHYGIPALVNAALLIALTFGIRHYRGYQDWLEIQD